MKTVKDLFRINMAEPSVPVPGSLLVAEPFLHEPHFNHAVIAMVDCDPGKPSMGVVLNMDTPYTLDNLIENVGVPVPVFCGGPMSTDRLFYLHTLGDILPGCREIATGLYIGGDLDAVCSYIDTGYPLEGHLRFFLGYSGWDTGQLDDELGKHVWAVADRPDAGKMLTGSGDVMWHRAVRELGEPYRPWLYHPRNPADN